MHSSFGADSTVPTSTPPQPRTCSTHRGSGTGTGLCHGGGSEDERELHADRRGEDREPLPREPGSRRKELQKTGAVPEHDQCQGASQKAHRDDPGLRQGPGRIEPDVAQRAQLSLQGNQSDQEQPQDSHGGVA